MAESQFLGEVSASELINGTDLCTALGLSGYSGANNNEPWLKFYDAVDNKTKFIAKKGYGASWSADALHAAGLAVGKTIQIGGVDHKVRLISGANEDPYPPSTIQDSPVTHGSEWNRLMYHIYDGEFGTYASETGAPGDWAQYSLNDLMGSAAGNRSYTICKERSSYYNNCCLRGSSSQGISSITHSGGTSIAFMFRPLLELVEQPYSDQRFSQTPQAILAIDDDHAVTNTSQMAQALLVGQEFTEQYFSQTPQSLLIVDDQDPTIYVSSFYANIIFSYDYGFTNVTQAAQAMLIVQPPPEFRADQVAQSFLAIDGDGPTRLGEIAQSLLKLQYFSDQNFTQVSQSLLKLQYFSDQNFTQVSQSLLVKEDESVFFMTFRALRLPEMETLYTSNAVRAFVTEGTDYIQIEGHFPEGSYLIRNGEPVGLTTPVAEGDYIAIHSGVTNYFTSSINIYKYGWKDGQVVRQMVGLWPVIQPSLDAVLRREQTTRSNYLSWLYDMHAGFTKEFVPDFYQNKSYEIDTTTEYQKQSIEHLSLMPDLGKQRVQKKNLDPEITKQHSLDINLLPVVSPTHDLDINLLPVVSPAHSLEHDFLPEVNEFRVLKFELLPDFRVQNIKSVASSPVRGEVHDLYVGIEPTTQKSQEVVYSYSIVEDSGHVFTINLMPAYGGINAARNDAYYLDNKYTIVRLNMEYDRIIPNINVVGQEAEVHWSGMGVVRTDLSYMLNRQRVVLQEYEMEIPIPSMTYVGAIYDADANHAETNYVEYIPVGTQSELAKICLIKDHGHISAIGYEFIKDQSQPELFDGQYIVQKHLSTLAHQDFEKYTLLPISEARIPVPFSVNHIFINQDFNKYGLANLQIGQDFVKYELESQLVEQSYIGDSIGQLKAVQNYDPNSIRHVGVGQEYSPVSIGQLKAVQNYDPNSIRHVGVGQEYSPVSIGQVGVGQEYSPVSIGQVGVGQEFEGESIGSTTSQQYHFKTTYTPKVIKQLYVITKTSYAKADLYAEAPKAKANYFYSAGRYGGYDTVQELRAYTEYFYEVNELSAFDGYRYTTDVDLSFTCELFSNGPVKWLLQGG